MSYPDITMVTKEIDLIFSYDDQGWYFQRATDWKVSQLFPFKELAMETYRDDKLEWS